MSDARQTRTVRPALPTMLSHAGAYWLLLSAFAAYLVFAATDEMTGLGVIRATAAVLGTQLLPGVLIWRCVRPRDGWLLEDVALGFAMGIPVAVPSQTIAGFAHHRSIAWVLPVLVAATFLLVPATRHRIVQARCSPLPWWLGGGIAALSATALPALIAYFRFNQPRWASGTGSPQVDTYLHLALSAELLNRGPAAWPTVVGEQLGYQWFAHAWIAQVTAVSGVSLDSILMRFLPVIMPIVAVSSIAALTLRLTRNPGIALGAVALASLGGQTTPFRFTRLYPLVDPASPTLGLAVPTLMALVAVLAMRWRGQAQRGAILLVPILTVIASGTKGSTAPVVIAGVALALVAMLVWNRRLAVPLAVDLGLMLIALVATVALVFHGSGSGLAFGVTESAKQTLLAGQLGGAPSYRLQREISALTILMCFGPAALGLAGLRRRADRSDPVLWVLLGAAVAGACAVGLFSHPGLSQGYFLLTALPLAAIASTIGAERILRVLSARNRSVFLGMSALGALGFFLLPGLIVGPLADNTFRRMELTVAIGALVLVTCATVAAVLSHHIGPPSKWRLGAGVVAASIVLTGPVWFYQYLVTTPISPTKTALSPLTPGVHSNGQIDAATYIRDHSGIHDLVMTNRHCRRPKASRNCDSRQWLVTGYSERQSLIEGWTATNTATRLAPKGRDSITVNYWNPALLQLNDDFYTRPSAAAARKLWDKGVRWVYMENTRPHAPTLAPYADLRYSNSDASAWQLRSPNG